MISLPVSPFTQLDRNQLIALLDSGREEGRSESSGDNRELYNGNHWNDGRGWIGPLPEDDNELRGRMESEIQSVFCSRNVVREVVDRKVDGLLKTRPHMSFVRSAQISEDNKLSEDDTTVIDEATDLVRKWFKDKKILKKLKEIYGRAQLDENVVARLYIPRGFLVKTSTTSIVPSNLEVYDYLDIIHLDVVVSENAGEIVDENTQSIGLVSEIVKENITITEVTYVENEFTIVRTIVSGDNSGSSDSQDTITEMLLDGNLTMYKPKIRPIITQQVRENQYAINLAKTMQNRNTITAGFLERIVLDAMPPGEWITDPNDEDNEIYQVGPFKTGAGTTNFYMAAEYRDKETGEVKHGSPSVYFRDPVVPSTFIESKRDCYQDILEEVGQPHILISSQSTESGRGREQARETYKGTLEDDAGEINEMINWIMETLVHIVAYLSGSPEKYNDLVAEAKCFINLGPAGGNDRQDNRLDVQAGQLSVKTAMMRSGIEDPQTELDFIAKEAAVSDDSLQKKIKMLGELIEIGVDIYNAAKLVGMTEEQAKSLEQNYTKPEVKTESKVDPIVEDSQGE